MASRRTLARGARVLSGVIGVAVAAAAIFAAGWLPLPAFSAPVPSATVTPVPAAQQRVCPGPLLDLASDSGNATAASAFGSAHAVSGSSAGQVSTRPLKAPDDRAGGRYGAPQVLTLPAESGATTPALLGGAQSQSAGQEDLAGLAASACGEASRNSWLVGGSTTLGQSSLVLLSNPSAVQASVDLTVYAETGRIDAPGARGILVDPGTQKMIALAGIAPNVTAPVVHVESRGGTVLASLQQSVVRGITADGAELVSQTALPSTRQVIAGLTVTNLAAATAAGSSEGYADTLPALRVLVPGDKAATVRVGLAAEKGTQGGSSTSATVQPHTAQEIPLDHLVDGSFSITVESTQPVVVAARSTAVGAASSDFAWYPASSALGDRAMVAVAAGPNPVIHLANASQKDVTVALSGAGGSSTVGIPAGSSVGVPAPSDGGVFTLSGASGLHASVGYSADGQIASYQIEPPGASAGPIVVYTR